MMLLVDLGKEVELEMKVVARGGGDTLKNEGGSEGGGIVSEIRVVVW